MENTTEIAVIGSGPGGYVAALYAAQQGHVVSLIEKGQIGGTCLNLGCIPTKSLVASSFVLNKFRKAAQYGIVVSGSIEPDWPAIQNRMNKISGTVRKGVEGLIENRKVELITGNARFIDQNRILIDNKKVLSAKNFIIATGSSPSILPQFNVDHERVLVSDDVLKIKTLPETMVIVGEGIIACEFAFIFRSLGVDVTLIGMEDRPLPTLDNDISEVIARELKKKKITFIKSTYVDHIDNSGDVIRIIDKNGECIAVAERTLVCIGRKPNSDNMGLEDAGIILKRNGSIEVNQYCQTSVKNIYAIGDVNANCMLAHSASRQGKLAVDHLLNRSIDNLIDYEAIPWSIFTDPEIGVVGKTEKRAREEGRDVKIGKFDTRGIGKAQVLGDLTGLVKVVIDSGSDTVLGVHIVGPEATELIQHATLAINMKLTGENIREQVFSHPTISESVQEAFEDAEGQAIHKPMRTILKT